MKKKLRSLVSIGLVTCILASFALTASAVGIRRYYGNSNQYYAEGKLAKSSIKVTAITQNNNNTSVSVSLHTTYGLLTDQSKVKTVSSGNGGRGGTSAANSIPSGHGHITSNSVHESSSFGFREHLSIY